MNRRTLLWSVYPYYLIIIIVSLLLTAVVASWEMRQMHLDDMANALEVRAGFVGRELENTLLRRDDPAIDRHCKEFGRLSHARITVIDAAGVVLGDSEQDPGTMENHRTRPEIAQALAGNTGMETRFSNTFQTTMMYVAVPVIAEGRIIGVVRTSSPITEIERTLHILYRRLLISGLIITAVATVISLLLFRRIGRIVADLQQGASRFAEGQLAGRLSAPRIAEFAALAESMNSMAANLDSRIRLIEQQRNEREAILSSMSEGVIALDAHENIVSLNGAAAKLLELEPETACGRPIHEVVRIAALHDFVGSVLKGPQPEEREIAVGGETERYLQIHGSRLLDHRGQRVGIVLVINDITRVKKLENIRRDFVANVSHELKTPITAITASVETLREGAAEKPEDYVRFLGIIARHAERLNNLVEDLMALARIENDAEYGHIELARHKIREILESSMQACRQKSNSRNIELVCACDDNIVANVNPPQLEQAMTNLLDNAIKYSDAGSRVQLQAAISGGELIISVRDHGCGIKATHLSRLFERFYRVEQGRSREAGGTGLGLAIVKHIAHTHGGRVSVDSKPGEGSTFRIHLPHRQ